MKKLFFVSFFVFLLTFVFAAMHPATVQANHSWNGYHWVRVRNPFVVMLGDNLSVQWYPYLLRASHNWSISAVLDTQIVQGNTNPAQCYPTPGRVQVCDAQYGNTGWLGLTQVQVINSHIIQATIKINDSYFNTPRYNTPAWRQNVLCHEIGHSLGLAHQDENFTNPPLGTCLDYSIDPTPNQTPNLHDYYELSIIYGRLDPITTVRSTQEPAQPDYSDFNNQSEWGSPIIDRSHKNAGRNTDYERDLGGGRKLRTDVFWAQ